MTEVRFNAVLFCDDVRRETTGKDILIGVYGGDILVNSFPQWLPLAIWAEIEAEKPGHHTLLFRLTYADNPPLNMKAEMNVSGEGPSGVSLPRLEVLVESEGVLALEVRRNNEEPWCELKRKQVRKRTSPVLPMGGHRPGEQ